MAASVHGKEKLSLSDGEVRRVVLGLTQKSQLAKQTLLLLTKQIHFFFFFFQTRYDRHLPKLKIFPHQLLHPRCPGWEPQTTVRVQKRCCRLQQLSWFAHSDQRLPGTFCTRSGPSVLSPAPLSPTCPLTRSYSLWDAPWFCCGPSLQEEVNKPYFVWLQGCFVQVFGLDFHMWKEVREQRVENRSYIRHLQMLATRNQQYKCAKSR